MSESKIRDGFNGVHHQYCVGYLSSVLSGVQAPTVPGDGPLYPSTLPLLSVPCEIVSFPARRYSASFSSTIRVLRWLRRLGLLFLK